MENTVLIVEDDSMVRESLQMILETYGYSVLSATNGKDALDTLKKVNKPCLILLDIMMPVMNGWEFLKAKDTEPKLKDMPVVILSAADANDPMAKKAVKFLPKPVNIETLLRVLSNYCENAPLPQ